MRTPKTPPRVRPAAPAVEPLEPRTLLSGTPAPLAHASATLSQPRAHPAAATVGGKVLIAGGRTSAIADSDVVDIYDRKTGQWSVAHLSLAREDLAAVAVGDKVLFAGGDGFGLDFDTDVVDVFDSSTGQWSVAHLSKPRAEAVAVAVGDRAIIAGGDATNEVDVAELYDAAIDRWSTVQLPRALDRPVATVVGGKAIFFDGTGTVTYDSATGAWSVGPFPQLNLVTAPSAAVTVGSKALFATGRDVAIYDDVTGRWSAVTYSGLGGDMAGVAVGTKALFAFMTQVDVYDTASGDWSQASLDDSRHLMATASVGDRAIFAGGTGVFAGGWLDTVDVFTDDAPAAALDGVVAPGPAGSHALSVTVRNTGDAGVEGPFAIAVYGSRGGHRSVLLGTQTVSRPLRAGATRVVTVRVAVPAGTLLSDYRLVAQADAADLAPTAFAARAT